MNNKAQIVKYFPLIVRDASNTTITVDWTNIGTRFTAPLRMAHYINNTDEYIQFSFDGIDPHIEVPPHSFVLWDYTANTTALASNYSLPERTLIRVRSLGPNITDGRVTISAIYAATS